MSLIYEKTDKIVTITLNRPEALNSIDRDTLTGISESMVKFQNDPEAWVAIITGAGEKAFCAGADLIDLVPAVRDNSYKVPPTIMIGQHINKPVIAAVNGIAFGGGLEIMMACDIRIAAKNARFGVPEVRWGIIPRLGGTQRAARMLPWAKAAELLLMGNNIDAEEALQFGLVNAVVELPELMSTAKKWAFRICENGPLAVRAAKEAMISGYDKPLDEGFEIEISKFSNVMVTKDADEGITAFAEKRKPVYRGE